MTLGRQGKGVVHKYSQASSRLPCPLVAHSASSRSGAGAVISVNTPLSPPPPTGVGVEQRSQGHFPRAVGQISGQPSPGSLGTAQSLRTLPGGCSERVCASVRGPLCAHVCGHGPRASPCAGVLVSTSSRGRLDACMHTHVCMRVGTGRWRGTKCPWRPTHDTLPSCLHCHVS